MESSGRAVGRTRLLEPVKKLPKPYTDMFGYYFVERDHHPDLPSNPVFHTSFPGIYDYFVTIEYWIGSRRQLASPQLKRIQAELEEHPIPLPFNYDKHTDIQKVSEGQSETSELAEENSEGNSEASEENSEGNSEETSEGDFDEQFVDSNWTDEVLQDGESAADATSEDEQSTDETNTVKSSSGDEQ
ncbi:hypothetical protein BT69DRAFT_1294005 [Atractiella rhizophila]|nr:hypothetical protein BT69DRAFT_1343714 [Atractiella rhizophila]KAH8927517.1 hypothetical protein BT69DRAFT_1294005 [Atractiella rhizophila]